MPYFPQAASGEAVESASFGTNLNLRHYWHIVLERRWLVIATFISVFVLCLVYLFKAPRIFAASARLQIDRESEATLNLNQVVMSMGALDQDYLQTQYRNLLSRTLLETVVKKEKLNEDSRYQKEMDIPLALAQDIAVSPIRLSRLVDVRVEHGSPTKAASIANTLVNEFIEQNVVQKQKRTLDLLFFLKSQANGLERDVAKAEEDIQNYRTQVKFVSLDSSYNIVAEALSQSQGQYAMAKSRAQTSQTTVGELERHVQSGKPLETFPTVATDQKVSSLQLLLANQENDLAGLLKRYKDKHPNVIQVKSKIEETRRAAERAAQQVAEILRSEARLARAGELNLAANVKEWEERQMEWNKAKMQYDVLVRKAESSKALFNTVLAKMKEIELVQKDKANNIRAVDMAYPPTLPVKPRVLITLFLGAFGGLGIAIGLAFFVNYLDDSIKSQDDVETYLHLPFLGYIPNIKTNSVVERDLQAHLHPQSNAAESFRTVRAALALGAKADKMRLFTVTSTIPSEGKSLVASNLAVVMAQTGLRTILVDADLRRPSLHKAFQLHSPVGLAAYLTEKAGSVDELIHTTEVANLDVICCGSAPSQPSELLGSRRMMQFIQEVGKRYERVILDCPPVSAVADPLILSAVADGVIFVTKFNKIRREHARKTVQRIQDAGIQICGVVLNDIDFEGRDSYYYSYYYYQNRYYSSYYRERPESPRETKPEKANPPPAVKA
jgi:capsular exopolysaccharide synthesis family protein